MNAAELFGPDWVPLLVSGIALLALAVWLFVLDMANRSQRIFALILGLRGLTYMIGPLRGASTSAREELLWTHFAVYPILPLVPLVLYFVSLYPRPRRWTESAAARTGVWAFVAVTLVWYGLDHAAYGTLNDGTGGYTGLYATYGPLFYLGILRAPVFTLAGLVLLRDYKRAPTGSKGFSLFLVVASFLLNGLYDGTLAIVEIVLAAQEDVVDWVPLLLTRGLPALALPIGLIGCAALLPVMRRARHDKELQEVTRFALIAVPLALASPFVRLLDGPESQDLATFVLGIWRLLIPFLVVYALMRYQLFNIDLHLKAGVRRGIILGAFAVTFFLVSEAAESMASGGKGPMFGIAAAGLLSLGSRPVQTFAAHAAEKFMPDTKPIAQQTHAERRHFYLDQYNLIFHDGEITPKERRMLDELRVTLSLDKAEADEIERTRTAPDTEDDGIADAGPLARQDTKLKIAITATLAAGTMALVFGMLSEGIESQIPVSNQLAGLIAAAFVALALGPIEKLADHLTTRIDPRAAAEAQDERRRRKAFEKALFEALADGHLSKRDLEYLASLQQRLGIASSVRWRMEKRVAFRLHHPRRRGPVA